MAFSIVTGPDFSVNLGNHEDIAPPTGDGIPPSLDCVKSASQDVLYAQDDLLKLKELGYYSVGAGVLIYDVQDGNIRFLLAKHKASEKHPEPVWSIPTETAQFTRTQDGRIKAESMLQTVFRCFDEELDWRNPSPVLQPTKTPWAAVEWVVSSADNDLRRAFVPITALAVPFLLDRITEDFESTPENEIEEIRMVSMDQLPAYTTQINKRNGLISACSQLFSLSLLMGFSNRHPFFDSRNLLVNDQEESNESLRIIPPAEIDELTRDETSDWEDLILSKIN
jgi:hypothetical protein